MKNPERCLLVVIGFYVLATLLSMVSDVSQPSTLEKVFYSRRFLGAISNSSQVRGSLNVSFPKSGAKTSHNSVQQPVEILIKYGQNSIFNNSTIRLELLSNTTRRRILLRRELQTKGVVHLNYAPFRNSEPGFASDEDRKLFQLHKGSVADLKPIPSQRLKGTIAWITNATISTKQDCGWGSSVETFKRQTTGAGTIHHKIICPLLVPDGNSFQHFVDGVLPKIVQAYEYIIQEDVTLLIYGPRDSIILEMLTALGFKKSQLLYYEGGTYFSDVMINTCITPPLHPGLWQTARRMLGAPENLAVHSRNASVILLTRAKHHNPGRMMTNSEDVLNFLLHRYGNNAILFKGGYSLAESVHLFRNAKIIVGVHGGAFYNIMYAPKGTNVIEVMPTADNGDIPRGLAHTIVWHMAGLLEQPYWRIRAKSVTKSANVLLSIPKLKKILDQVDKM